MLVRARQPKEILPHVVINGDPKGYCKTGSDLSLLPTWGEAIEESEREALNE